MKRKQKGFVLAKPHNWLIFELMNEALKKVFPRYASGRLLDIGCGIKPYKAMLSDYVTEHVGLDHEASFHDDSEVDLVGTAYKVPADDAFFDTILCSYVLEHLEEPESALREAHRLLKPGGVGIYTVPLFWHLHEEPRDFYRYTKYGLEYLFKKTGFEVVELIPISGFIVTFAQELAYYLWRFRYPKFGRLNPVYWLVRAGVFGVQYLALKLNKYDKSQEFTIEYLVVVRKK